MRFRSIVTWNIDTVVFLPIFVFWFFFQLMLVFSALFPVSVISLHPHFFSLVFNRCFHASMLSWMLATLLLPSFLDTYSMPTSSVGFQALTDVYNKVKIGIWGCMVRYLLAPTSDLTAYHHHHQHHYLPMLLQFVLITKSASVRLAKPSKMMIQAPRTPRSPKVLQYLNIPAFCWFSITLCECQINRQILRAFICCTPNIPARKHKLNDVRFELTDKIIRPNTEPKRQ